MSDIGAALAVARHFDDDAFACDFAGQTAINLPTLDVVIPLAATPEPTLDAELTFRSFAATNRTRCEAPDGFGHPLSGWTLSDWLLAATGEFGEAANVAKKLNRERDGIPGNTKSASELRADLADEFADAVIYLDLAAQSQGIDLGSAVVSKFNRTSEKIGAPHRLLARLHERTEPMTGPDHEHYWVDAPDDETGWHCTICGLTEYPEPPFGAEPPADTRTPDQIADDLDAMAPGNFV